MKNYIKHKHQRALRRAHRTRINISGTAECPRLSIKRSAKHIYAQFIDDANGVTLAAASDADVKNAASRVETATAVGVALSKRAAEAGITRMVVDRGSYKYHGRVKALVEAVEEAGISKKKDN